MFKITKTKLISMLLVGLVFVSSQGVFALSMGGISGKPAGNPYSSLARTWFVYTLEPGTEIQDAVEVYNPTDKEKTILIYPADTTPSSEGGFALKQRVEPMTDLGTWITMEKNEVVLAPGSAEIVPFTIKVPAEGLDVGEHSGGVMIEEKQTQTGGNGVMLSTRVGLRVYVTIPGDMIKKIDYDFLKYEINSYRNYKLPFGSEDQKKKPFLKVPQIYDFQMGVLNSGNVSTDVNYEFNVEDVLFGANDLLISKQQKTARDTATLTHFEWKAPLFGKYRVSVKANYMGKDAQMQDDEQRMIESEVVELWIVPWDLLIGIFLLLIVIVSGILLRKNLRKKSKKPQQAKAPKAKTTKVAKNVTTRKPAKAKATKATKSPAKRSVSGKKTATAKTTAKSTAKKPAKTTTKTTAKKPANLKKAKK